MKKLLSTGANINTRFDIRFKNETLLNTKFQNLSVVDLQFLIENNFDFVELGNLSNILQATPLTALSMYSNQLDTLKLFYQHCNQLSGFDLNILYCNDNGWNAMHSSTQTHFTSMEFLLSKIYFPNNDKTNEKGIIATNWQTKEHKNTPAHKAAYGREPSNVKHLQLLHKYGCNFNIFNKYGFLPIHIACHHNAFFVLSWMIQSNIYQNFNVLTTATKQEPQTPLNIAINRASVECVEVLCNTGNNITIAITGDDISDTLRVDNTKILQQLLCTLFEQHKINDWTSIEKLPTDSLISDITIAGYRMGCRKPKCTQFLIDLMYHGYYKRDYHYIAHILNYNVKSIINNNSNIGQSTLKITDKYNIQQKLGSGTFGQVKYAVNKQTKQKAAIKYISLKKSSASPQFISTEIDAISKITHKNVIKLIDYDVRPNKSGMVALVFEYAPYGELYQFLSRVNCFDFHLAFIYFEQILSGLQACHGKNIVHRDLKGQNILLSSTFQIKIADFGLASIIHDNDTDSKSDEIYNVGTPRYKAPELLEGTTMYDIKDIAVLKACDVFSVAIIFWEMINGAKFHPFKLYNTIYHGKYQHIIHKKYDKFWNIHKKCNILKHKYFQELCDLFNGMFCYNPLKRLTISKILTHEWMKKCQKMDHNKYEMEPLEFELTMKQLYHSSKFTKLRAVAENEETNDTNDNKENESKYEPSYQVSELIDWGTIDPSFNTSSMKSQSNKIHSMKNPIVVMVGISNYESKTKDMVHNDLPDKPGVIYDYKNVEMTFYQKQNWDVVFQTENNNIVHLKRNNVFQESKQSNYKVQWRWEEIQQFHANVCEFINKNNNKCDGLIYILSCHIKTEFGMQTFYDSNGNEIPCDFIFDTFNNVNLQSLNKKPKIFVFDGNYPMSQFGTNSNINEYVFNKSKDASVFQQMCIDKKHKFIIFNNMSSSSLGGYLIHSICAILSNIGHKRNVTLESLIDEIRNRIEEVMNNANKQISQNVLFTSSYIPGTVIFGSSAKTNTVKYEPQLDDIKESTDENENNAAKNDTKTSIENILSQIKRNVARNVHQSIHSSQST